MYNSFNKSFAEFTYLIERISIVTKEFLRNLNKDNKFYNQVYKIYKSTQSINYEFIKLYYSIKADKNSDFILPDIDTPNIEISKVKSIDEYALFINSVTNPISNFTNSIYNSSNKYPFELTNELNNFIALINNLNFKKTADDF